MGVYLPVVGLWALLKQDGEDLGHVAGVDEGAQAAVVVSAPGVLRNELRRDPHDGVDKGGGPDQGRRDARASPVAFDRAMRVEDHVAGAAVDAVTGEPDQVLDTG